MYIFLSYASEDGRRADSIALSLRSRGDKVFFDRDDLPAGGSYDQQIESAVKVSDIFIFLVSPESVTRGRYTLTELKFAREKWSDPAGSVLPVLVRATPRDQIPTYLTAVTILEPEGNLAAETSAAVDKMRHNISDMPPPVIVAQPNLWSPVIVAFGVFFTVYLILGFLLFNKHGSSPDGALKQLLDVLGLGAPFLYAAATYGLFHWLDTQASDPAKKAISDWLQPKQYDNVAVSDAILDLFNRVYTDSLFSWKAAVRSILITVTVTAICLFETSESGEFLSNIRPDNLLPLFVNIAADYVSLFAVKWLLINSRERPTTAAVLGPLFGALIVFMANMIRPWTRILYKYFIWGNYNLSSAIMQVLKMMKQLGEKLPVIIQEESLRNQFYPTFFDVFNSFSVAAMVVHLWLPLFVICVASLRLLNYFFVAIGWAQWFIKRGKYHPFDAIGYVAAVLIFAGTVLLRWSLALNAIEETHVE